MVIDLAVPCADWLEVETIKQAVSRSARQAIRAAMPDIGKDVEISIVLGSDDLLRSLNLRYRNKDEPTNVLSFPSGEDVPDQRGPKLLGDVILAHETVSAQAQTQGKSILDHACHLTVHGVLHLLGMTHDKDECAQHMEQMEIDIMASLGLPNPYVALSGVRIDGGGV